MTETLALNITAMFLPSSLQPPRGFMQGYAPVWRFQNHKLCTTENKPLKPAVGSNQNDDAGGMPGSANVRQGNENVGSIRLKRFEEYDADGSGFLEFRTVDEAGAASGLGDPCGISDTSIVRCIAASSRYTNIVTLNFEHPTDLSIA